MPPLRDLRRDEGGVRRDPRGACRTARRPTWRKPTDMERTVPTPADGLATGVSPRPATPARVHETPIMHLRPRRADARRRRGRAAPDDRRLAGGRRQPSADKGARAARLPLGRRRPPRGRRRVLRSTSQKKTAGPQPSPASRPGGVDRVGAGHGSAASQDPASASPAAPRRPAPSHGPAETAAAAASPPRPSPSRPSPRRRSRRPAPSRSRSSRTRSASSTSTGRSTGRSRRPARA